MTADGAADEAERSSARAPTVSAVIPAYNAEATIERALASVYAQDYADIIEVIVVDDESTDTTAGVARSAFPQTVVIRQKNTGDAGARNTGIRHASGDYVAFLDADDEWTPEKTTVQLEIMDRYPGIDVLTCHFAIREGSAPEDLRVVKIAGDALVNTTHFEDWLLWFVPARGHPMLSNASGLLVRRDLFARIGMMDETVVGSIELMIRAAGLGCSVVVAGRPLSIIHPEPGSHSRSEKGHLELSSLAISIISRYDPSGDGWEANLLTQEQFDSAMHRACRFGAKFAHSGGDTELAADYYARSLRHGRHGPVKHCVLKLGAFSPDAYRRFTARCGRIYGRMRRPF